MITHKPIHQPQHIHGQDTVPEIPVKNKDSSGKKEKIVVYVVFGILIMLGVITGYLMTEKSGSTLPVGLSGGGFGVKTFGSSDTKTFSDTTTGVVEKDGVGGEGTHNLIREGGPSQTACLVSSVLDLELFVGKKVKVWSKTMDAKKCPWLMDVGRIELQ